MTQDLMAPPSSEELKLAKLMAPPSPEELSAIQKPSVDDHKPTLAERQQAAMIDLAKAGGNKLLEGAAWAGDKIERYIDAPWRAGMGAVAGSGVMPTPGKIADFSSAAYKQFGEDTLPTTPSGKDLALKAGYPEPIAGFVGGVMQPSLTVPFEQVVAGPAKLAASATRGAVEFAAPVAKVAGSALEAGQKGVLALGEKATKGELNAAQAFEHARFEPGLKLIDPQIDLHTLGKVMTGELLGGHKGALVMATLSKATQPRTYMQIVGLSKLPGDAARSLMGAYEAGSTSEMAKLVSDLSQKYPEEMNKIAIAVSERANEEKSNPAMKAIQMRAQGAKQ